MRDTQCNACALNNFVVASRDRLGKFFLQISKFSPPHGTHYFVCPASPRIATHTVTSSSLIGTPNCVLPVVKVPLDARERSSCTSSYWDPAFPHLKFHRKSPEPLVGGPFWPKADIEFPHLWFSTLTTACYGVNCLSCQCEACLSRWLAACARLQGPPSRFYDLQSST